MLKIVRKLLKAFTETVTDPDLLSSHPHHGTDKDEYEAINARWQIDESTSNDETTKEAQG
jgi:hypothetical protein